MEDVDQQQEQDAVMAGFESTDVEPVEQVTQDPTPVEETPAVEEVEMAKLTKADYDALVEKARKIDAFEERLAKVSSGVNGKIGSIIQQLDSLKSSAQGLSPKARERVTAEFPELAEMMFDEEAAVTDTPVQQTPVVDTKVADALEQYKRENERKLLKLVHKDWEQVVGDGKFHAWMDQKLTADERQAFGESWDAEHVGGRISEFKQYMHSIQPAPPVDTTNKDRLDGAVTPRGLPRGSVSVSPEDEEEAAMLKAFGGRR